MRRALAALLLAGSLLPATSRGQATACLAVYSDRTVTLQFARQARVASQALLLRLEPAMLAAAAPIDEAILAEAEGKPQPVLLRQALAALDDVDATTQALDDALAALAAVDKQDRRLAVYEDALARILRDRRAGGWTPDAPLRHAHAAAASPPPAAEVADVAGILRRQREDAAALRRSVDELRAAARDAVPLAEKGGIADAAFAGRVALLAKLRQAMARLESARAFALESCAATWDAVFQIYPTGLEYLEETTNAEAKRGLP
jgi:hypothetical protein